MASEAAQSAPGTPAPVIPLYPQFRETQIPNSTSTVRALRGYIRPFSDDENAKRVLRAINANRILLVDEGRLDYLADDLPVHEHEQFLANMAHPCTVVVLDHVPPRHPSAYLIDPAQQWLVSSNPHTWWGREHLEIEGRKYPELCVYSGNLCQFDPAYDKMTQFLNQLSTYVAKHLIYLSTRMLHKRRSDGSWWLMHKRRPWERINPDVLKLGKHLSWRGTWPGEGAPSGPAAHLQTIDPDEECWCNSGISYKSCHMEDEEHELSQRRNPKPVSALDRFVRAAIAAR